MHVLQQQHRAVHKCAWLLISQMINGQISARPITGRPVIHTIFYTLYSTHTYTHYIIDYIHTYTYIYAYIHIYIICCLFLPGLIIHEGSSVYRIFKRWQAVNQQWKVLNYEKSKDLGDPISSSSKAGARGSRGNTHGLASGGGRGGGQRVRRLRTILNHHCGYTILHILSQIRPSDGRLGTATNREVVMRVTTV